MARITNFTLPSVANHGITRDDGDAVQHTVPHIATRLSGISSTVRFKNVIFDLGDVLFTYSTSSSKSPISSAILRRILRSSIWFEYEKGNLTEEQAYEQVAKEYNLSANDVACSFSLARESLKSNLTLIDTITAIKASGRRVFAMSNMSAPDWMAVVKILEPSQWALFDEIFIS
jgi:FMN phosphatase YigB (HAD superfamily)